MRPEQRVAALVYGATLTMCCFLFNVIWWYARRHPGVYDISLDPQPDQRRTQTALLVLLGSYVVATLLAFVSAPLSIGLYVVLTTLVAVPSSDDHTRRGGPRPAASKQHAPARSDQA